MQYGQLLPVVTDQRCGLINNRSNKLATVFLAIRSLCVYRLLKATAIYLFGDQANILKAVKLYRKAAEQGNTDAQFRLGMCYEGGRGVAKDETEAIIWYRKAAERGYAVAQSVLSIRNWSRQR